MTKRESGDLLLLAKAELRRLRKNLRQARYAKRHPEQIALYAAAYRKTHRDTMHGARQRKYAALNKLKLDRKNKKRLIKRNNTSRETAGNHCTHWCANEDVWILQNIGILTQAQMAEYLGRTRFATARRIQLLNAPAALFDKPLKQATITEVMA